MKGVDDFLFIFEEGFKQGGKARADRDYSGVSSLRNSSKVYLEFLY
ncbi:hypothetical protein D060_11194 [Streptococcus pneumoniae 845]|mgnify:FL=1|nr:hypothetical protein SPCG_0015 [Streptococcus pneumoniae CGSP14]ADM90122.1 hypothetical protein SP670_0040 [Streptococcus pneumoniae 670-6B]EDK68702.1 hypothetical protein CGSSp18BS74_06177 [Streptococcus pneumoniae SP18-BS74]EFL64645.1 hypothetical protein CGSSpBS455_08065 [Streptococcus pneumoniae BS455]EFL68138.1 hypothetical protein CGSSp14BS292_01528 [Streptococcus pneumoniae SP14-BS292]EFL68653.1 hypothetical protein CGSSpBS293_03748 [Streptococcus pneumoniae SP-BS293]EFL71369.1 hypo